MKYAAGQGPTDQRVYVTRVSMFVFSLWTQLCDDSDELLGAFICLSGAQ